MQTLRHEFRIIGTLVLLLVTLNGCSKSEHAGVAAAHSGRPTVKKGTGAGAPELANMVSAVGAGKSGAEIGDKTPQIEHPQVGVAITHTVTIIPRRDGVFYVSAVVLADSATESVTRAFSIPVIAGTGVSAPIATGVNQAQGAGTTSAH